MTNSGLGGAGDPAHEKDSTSSVTDISPAPELSVHAPAPGLPSTILDEATQEECEQIIKIMGNLGFAAAILVQSKDRLLVSNVSPTFTSTIQTSHENIVGRTMREILPIGIARFLELQIQSALQSNKPISTEIALQDPDNNRAQSLHLMLSPDPHRRSMITISITNMTTIVAMSSSPETERDHSAINEALDQGLCFLDGEARVIDHAPVVAQLLNQEDKKLKGIHFQDLLNARGRKTFIEAFESVTSGAIQSAAREVQLVGEDGSLQWVMIHLTRMLPIADERTFLAIISNVSKLRKLQSQLRETEDRAQQANKIKSRFLSHMSHEFRTPLNGIIGFSEIINQEVLGPVGSTKYKDYAGDIHFSAKHLLEVINDVLDMSRIESGKVELEEATIDVAELADEVRSLVAASALERNVELSFESHPRFIVRADRRLLRQVLTNLVANGIKFTGPGGRVSTVVKQLADNSLAFVINDTGIGIESSAIEEVLTPFITHRVMGDRPTQMGTGLGLPISKSFMEMHGGRLFINSELGSGTSVFAILPRSRIVFAEPHEDPNLHRKQMRQADYEATKLAHLIDEFTDEQIDRLPVGVIKLDREGFIEKYNAVEGAFSGLLSIEAVGKNYFTEIAPCVELTSFQEKFKAHVDDGTLDEFFDFIFNFPRRPMNVRIHLKSSRTHDGAWAFIHWV